MVTSFKGIAIVPQAQAQPVRLPSGAKYRTADGVAAIKNGVKAAAGARGGVSTGKPRWLRAPMPGGDGFAAMDRLVEQHGLATVCKEARCPNIGECWNGGTATLMLLGKVCTRACRFCAVDTGQPRGLVDGDEPANVARTVQLLGLRYVVLTSVNRDDLPDGGAAHFARTVRTIREMVPATSVEALTPDFQGRVEHVDTVVHSGLTVFAQNLETVERLTHPVRDARAGYRQTLAVLAHAKSSAPHVLTKSSLMLGLGETDGEILRAMDDLRAAKVDILTLGQYLRPTPHHLPVQRFVSPEGFEHFRSEALARGFAECVAGPLVRSSYRAEQALQAGSAGVRQ